MKISVIAHPGAKKNVVKQEQDILTGRDVYHVYTFSQPVNGDANNSIMVLLAEFFGVKKYQMRLVSGQKSKQKIIEIVEY